MAQRLTSSCRQALARVRLVHRALCLFNRIVSEDAWQYALSVEVTRSYVHPEPQADKVEDGIVDLPAPLMPLATQLTPL